MHKSVDEKKEVLRKYADVLDVKQNKSNKWG